MLLKHRLGFVGVHVLFACFAGCAGSGQLMKFDEQPQLPKDLSRELQEKFEIKDELTPSVTSSASGAAGAQLKRSSKKRRPKKQSPHIPKKEESQEQVTAPKGVSAGTPVVVEKPFTYPKRRPESDAIWVGEKQVYNVTYFGVSAGDFVTRVLPFKMISARKVFHVEATAISSKMFSLFYRLNDKIESFIDYEGIFTHRFHILLDESNQARDALELNDSEKGDTYYWNRWQRKGQPFLETQEHFAIQPFSQDSLSALYYLRSIPLPDGAVITFPVINEGKTWDAVVTVVRREIIHSPMGEVKTVVLRPESKYEGILKKQGEQLLWLTDDDRKFLVRLEAKVKIGTIVAQLKELEPGTSVKPR